ncbi:hypothetical protein T05_5201 [Trichinella murrelli]|uniref:Uncharacterized protein n=1 Tax=Trichinella murrelli TaxID=144512 RepID=A0A0V0TJ08_9BILA|nr:hypothetical protein T05_5201 [Trichinella murrelli]
METCQTNIYSTVSYQFLQYARQIVITGFVFVLRHSGHDVQEGEKFCIYTLSKTGQLTIQIGRRKMNSGSRNVRLGCAFED